jgi:hypothetical protein
VWIKPTIEACVAFRGVSFAKADDRTLSAYVNRVLRRHVEEMQGKKAKH